MQENSRNRITTSIKAFVTGALMTIPGVSGGSIAMVLGEYDNLIKAVPGLLKKSSFLNSVIYLAIFLVCACLGIVIASKPVTYLMGHYSVPVMYFILGTIIGSVPMIVKKATLTKKSWPYAFCILIGMFVVYSIELLPQGIFNPTIDWSFSSIMIQLIGGVFISVGFILPGVSISYLLVVLSLYEPVFTLVGNMDILPLIPLGVGLVLGVFLLTGLVKTAMEKYPKATYMTILGFLLSSMIPLFPGLPTGWNILSSLISFAFSTLAIYFITSKSK